jgi:hypothetical protein
VLSVTVARPRANRPRAIAAAALPTARAAALGSAAATAALGVTPIVVTVVRGGSELGVASIVAGLVGGVALAWAADDSMADILAATPVGNPVRLMVRVAFMAVTTAIMWSVGAVMAATGPGVPPGLWLRTAEVAAAAPIALIIGIAAARLGERHVGVGGVIGGLLAVLTIAAMAQRWRWLPTLPSGPAHDGWWLVAAAGFIILLRVARDPGRR